MRTRASGATGPRNAMRSVSAAGVGASSRSAAESSIPQSSESETSTSTAESESPPSSKKSSATPDALAPERLREDTRHRGLRGAFRRPNDPVPPGGPNGGGSASGSGRALRSTLPDAVRGSRSRKTKAPGTMYARQRPGHRVTDLLDRRQRPVFPHDPRDQARALGAADGIHDGFADPGDPEQDALDLADLDPMPADLEPRSLAAGVQQATVRKQPAQVAGAVHAHARTARDREKRRRGLLRILPVADGERARDDGDLPLVLRRLPRVVEQNDLRLVHRMAER